VYVFAVATGKLLAQLEHKRLRQPVRACAFSADATYVASRVGLWSGVWQPTEPRRAVPRRNLVYVGGDALLWRYDVVAPTEDAAT
jgi:hypothetical protein